MSNNNRLDTYKKTICNMVKQLSDESKLEKIYRLVYYFWCKKSD